MPTEFEPSFSKTIPAQVVELTDDLHVLFPTKRGDAALTTITFIQDKAGGWRVTWDEGYENTHNVTINPKRYRPTVVLAQVSSSTTVKVSMLSKTTHV